MEVKSELEIFFSYADKDEEWQEELEKMYKSNLSTD
jgi:hypothetical protein